MRGDNHFRSSSFSMGDTYNERTHKFVGVDLTSPASQVDLKRGIYSNNYVLKPNGRVETRFGYEQAYRGPLYINAAGTQIIDTNPMGSSLVKPTAIWEFEADSNVILVIAFERSGHIYLATGAYYGSNIRVNLSTDVLYAGLLPSNMKRKSPFGTFSNGKLWVLTGGDFVVVWYDNDQEKLVASSVSSYSETHVPTVRYMGVADNAENIPSITNVTLEYPNLLNKYRKDMFLTGLWTEPTSGIRTTDAAPLYRLVGADASNTEVMTQTTIELEYLDDDGQYVKETFIPFPVSRMRTGIWTVVSSQGNYYYPERAQHSPAAILIKSGTAIPSFMTADGATIKADKRRAHGDYPLTWKIYDDEDEPNETDLDGNVVGYIYSTGEKWYVALDKEYEPVLSGKPNLTIKYPYVTDAQLAEQASFINKCTFGTLFGKNNSLNRLWLAGNPDQPNCAIHSAESYKGLEDTPVFDEADMTYFPDEGKIRFGEPNNAIVGMVPLSPDKMMVLKNRHANDRTMYFITPFDVSETIISAGTYGTYVSFTTGDVQITREQYSTSMSNTSTAGFSQETVDNFNGETLFLSSEKQIVGLDIEGITGDSQRVANTRSYYIDGELSGMDLSGSQLFHSGNYLYFVTDDKLYVTTYGSLSSETRQFEWWPCDIPLTSSISFFVGKSGTVYVISGDNNGTIEKLSFEVDELGDVCDKERWYITEGRGTISSNHGITLTSNTIPYKADSLASGEIKDDFNRFYQDTSKTNLFEQFTLQYYQANFRRYFPVFDAYTLSCFAKYRVFDSTFTKVTAYEDAADDVPEDSRTEFPNAIAWYSGSYLIFPPPADGVTSGTFYMTLENEALYLFNMNEGTYTHRLYMEYEGGLRQITTAVSSAGGASAIFAGYVEHKAPIKPTFVSLRLTQGKIGYDKIIDQVTVWNDSNAPCELYVAEIGKKEYEAGLGYSSGFDFENLNFLDTHFAKTPTPRFYNLHCFNKPKQSFTICFTAKTKRNSVLAGVDILYRVKKASNKR